MKARLTAERIRALLHYDPLTGVFTRLVKTCNSVKVGDVAGFVSQVDGYTRISVEKQQYLGHVLAWVYMTGKWPEGEIDHWDTDRGNTRFANLRDVSTKVNSENKRSARADNKSSGLLGVTWDAKRGKWLAQIGIRNDDGSRRNKTLGRYRDKHVAHLAYVNAKRQLHVGCTI
jgi:hypothetical protein